MKPITRIEHYLAFLANDADALGLPDPIIRVEKYLSKIAGGSATLPDRPITRVEMYLARIAGQSVSIPDKPITRIEMYLAAIAGQGNEVPAPITRVEMYLAEWAEGGSSGKNLLDMAEENIRLRYYINDSGTEASNNQNFYNTKFIPVKPNTAYTLSASEPVYYLSFMEYDNNKGFLQRTLDGSSSEKHSSTTITTRADTAYILIGSNPNRVTMNMDDVTSINWMLNEGSTPLPYEPYTEGTIADDVP